MYADLSMRADLPTEAIGEKCGGHPLPARQMHVLAVGRRRNPPGTASADGRECCGAAWGRHRAALPVARQGVHACMHAQAGRGGDRVGKTCNRRSANLSGENNEIADLLIGLTMARRTRGLGQCFCVSTQRSTARLEPQNGLPDHR
jgi:hypothetical protein